VTEPVSVRLPEISAACLAHNPGIIPDADWAQFVGAYLQHLSEDDSYHPDPFQVAAQVAAHVKLGAQRIGGEDLVQIVTPETGAGELVTIAGSTLVQLVTTDRPFLVDTVTMELRRLGWELRNLEHPQLRVRRDESGKLLGVADGFDRLAASSESWLSLEVYPSLGESAESGAPALLAGVKGALQAVRLVVDDWGEMLQRLEQARQLLAENQAAVPETELTNARELLSWLPDNFIFLGYQEFAVEGDSFTPVPQTGLGIQRGNPSPASLSGFHAVPLPGSKHVLAVTKHPQRSPVYRPVYTDYIGVRAYSPTGELIGEHRFLGLFAASAYEESVPHIPVLAAKARELLLGSGYPEGSYGWNALVRVIADYPRDELFDASTAELAPIVTAISQLRDRRLVRVYLRRDRYGQFASVLVYLPRDRYTTKSRSKISAILLEELGGEELDYTTSVSEAVLTRLFYVVKLGPNAPSSVNEARLQELANEAVVTWDDRVMAQLTDRPAEGRGIEFSEAYQEVIPPETAVRDMDVLNRLDAEDDLEYVLEPHGNLERFKVYTFAELDLHEVLPHLAQLGADVVEEQPFTVTVRGRPAWVYDFGLRLPASFDGEAASRQRLIAAFNASYRGWCESGPLNRLVLTAGLEWEEVVWLRGISRYLKQARVGYSQAYMASALEANPQLTAGLVAAFRAKFDPDGPGDADAINAVAAGIEQVTSLDADRILRHFVAFIKACKRTNAFEVDWTRDDEYGIRPALAYKIASRELELLPQPRPMAEISVYSPRVHGVHLRFGPVARGGLRWSDRAEDFRTEVLSLAKAQTVKNTVIVPVGAKGGFVPQQLPDNDDRAAWLAEGVACYRSFVAALLSVTDNYAAGQVVPPARVRCFDGDDPYLVVAADKGTATFSDIANQVALDHGFWLGDAFASGGSAGYDHKAMGITARGAWESTKRHFAELGLDPQTTDFTVVGIGDMSGDVFGNGMLLSEHIRLVAAFDHRDIFLDPNPDAAASFAERRRLFELPRSSWADYHPELISAGGGVYPRSAKSIPITPEVQAALGLESRAALTPSELIHAILQAPVDLLYNGGIGTLVKASWESHADAGDKANDAVRVDGCQVRARAAVEGGNLGWTQAGRIEYAAAGGAINTDFIDNSAGVDTSDHEVNIKILLADVIGAGELPAEEREALLATMTDDIAIRVLRHNEAQNLALSNAGVRAVGMVGQHSAWMSQLEADGILDRELEGLPSELELKQRLEEGRGLTRPELAVLLAYTKIALKSWMLSTDLPEDPYLADRLTEYFPEQLKDRFAALMPGHRLAREIITTVAVNRFVDSQGITAFYRLSSETGAGIADVVRAQLAARSIYQVGLAEVLLRRMSGLDDQLSTELRLELRRMVERATRWLLHNRRTPLDIKAAVAEFAEPVALVRQAMRGLLTEGQSGHVERKEQRWLTQGAPEELATSMAVAGYSHFALGIVAAARRLEVDPVAVTAVHFRLVELLHLDALGQKVYQLPRRDRWEAMSRAALRDELLSAQVELTIRAVHEAGIERIGDPDAVVRAWRDANPGVEDRIKILRALSEEPPDLARMSVGLGQVRALLAAH
jgi:glutamate dehydrogenase